MIDIEFRIIMNDEIIYQLSTEQLQYLLLFGGYDNKGDGWKEPFEWTGDKKNQMRIQFKLKD